MWFILTISVKLFNACVKKRYFFYIFLYIINKNIVDNFNIFNFENSIYMKSVSTVMVSSFMSIFNCIM